MSDTFEFDHPTDLIPGYEDAGFRTSQRGIDLGPAAEIADDLLRRLMAVRHRVDPVLAAALVRLGDTGMHRLLGFDTLRAYVEEGLTVGWAKAKELRMIHRALEGLPVLAAAFRAGRLPWSKARHLATVAEPSTEERWLGYAGQVSARALQALVRRVRDTGELPWGEPAGAEAETEAAPSGDPPDPEACEFADEEWYTYAYLVPPRVRVKWEKALEACRRQASNDLPQWQMVEYLAIEAFTHYGVPPPELDDGEWDRVLERTSRPSRHRGPRRVHPLRPAGWRSKLTAGEANSGPLGEMTWVPVKVLEVGLLERELSWLESVTGEGAGAKTARRLHAGLRRLVRFRERVDRLLGQVLRFFHDHRLYDSYGMAGFRTYLRERLGLRSSTADDLLRTERILRSDQDLDEAWSSGRIGSVQVRLLSQVVHDLNREAWVRHAESVTVRRLKADVRWALDLADRDLPGWHARGWLPPGPGEGPFGRLERVAGSHAALEAGTGRVLGEDTGGRPCSVFDEEDDRPREANPSGRTCSVLGADAPSGSEAGGRTCRAWTSSADVEPGCGVSGRTCSGFGNGDGATGADPGGRTCRASGQEAPAGSVAGGRVGGGRGPMAGPLRGAGGRASRSPDTPSARIRLRLPRSIAISWVGILDAMLRAHPDLPFWQRLERLLDHALEEWSPENDPDWKTDVYPCTLFERDGWECRVPGCTNRVNLTPHHVVFRSKGGGDELENLVTVCWRHHTHGIHGGKISVTGKAPDRLLWHLGRTAGLPPLLVAASGDRVLDRNDEPEAELELPT